MSKEKKKENPIHFPVHFQELEAIDKEDVRFTKVRIWLLHLGLSSDKGINFSKEVVDNAIPTLKNIPIVASVDKFFKDFKGHEATKMRDGSIKKGTHVVGVIPETNNAEYRERLCDDYVTRTFLTVDGLLWNSRSEEEVNILKRDGGVKGQSMELNGELSDFDIGEDGIMYPTKIGFEGACILGELVQPSMQNSTIELLYSKEEIEGMAHEIQEKLSMYYYERSSEKSMDKIVCKACGLEQEKGSSKCTCEGTEFITLEEFEANKVENEKKTQDPNQESTTVEDNLVSPVVDEGEDKGEGKEGEVKVEPTIEPVVEPTKELEEASNEGKVKLPTEFSMEEFNALKQEIEDLKNYKIGIEAEKREVAFNTLFEKYKMLEEVEDYKSLKARQEEFSAEEFDKESALIFTNNVNALNFSKSSNGEEKPEEDKLFYGLISVSNEEKKPSYMGLINEYNN